MRNLQKEILKTICHHNGKFTQKKQSEKRNEDKMMEK
jgi:hypothetical protein